MIYLWKPCFRVLSISSNEDHVLRLFEYSIRLFVLAGRISDENEFYLVDTKRTNRSRIEMIEFLHYYLIYCFEIRNNNEGSLSLEESVDLKTFDITIHSNWSTFPNCFVQSLRTRDLGLSKSQISRRFPKSNSGLGPGIPRCSHFLLTEQ